MKEAARVAGSLRSFLSNYKTQLGNFGFLSLMDLFNMATPIFMYPMVIERIGLKSYGYVITAQVAASYMVFFVDLGLRTILPRNVSKLREDRYKLSEIVSAALLIRLVMWIVSLFLYMLIIPLFPMYNDNKLLLIYAFGITFNELLFPVYYFQGIEKMKFISVINIAVNSLYICLVYFFLESSSEAHLITLFKGVTLLTGGLFSLYIVFGLHGLTFVIPKFKFCISLVKESKAIFLTELLTTIKDKFGVFLIGSYIGMSELVIYDLGSKFTSIMAKPVTVISKVVFPLISLKTDVNVLRKVFYLNFAGMLGIVTLFNIFIGDIVAYFIDETAHTWVLRIFSLAPIFLSLSSFLGTNGLIAFGKSRLMLSSIGFTTMVYITLLGIIYFMNWNSSLAMFVLLTVITYMAEFIFRLYHSGLREMKK